MNPAPPPSEVITERPGTDVDFECHAKPSTSRSLPLRSCRTENINYDDSDSGNEVIEKNLDETPNLNESKNCNQDEENNWSDDSDPYGYRAEMLGQHFTSSDDDDDDD